MERLDKIIASQGEYSRKEVKKLVSQGRVVVNDKIVRKSDEKFDTETDIIKIDGVKFDFSKYIYLVLNKPKGYVSATRDNKDETVMKLLPEQYLNREIFPAGRLDKDTTGLMILTDDGTFAHNILSPRKHVKKIYLVTIDIPVTEEMKKGFEDGIELNDGKCKSAELEILGENIAKVTLREGRYHQIKRMFGIFGAKVIELRRVKMGDFELPSDLKMGECRELSKEELLMLQEKISM